jgi:hypothetical protein
MNEYLLFITFSAGTQRSPPGRGLSGVLTTDATPHTGVNDMDIATLTWINSLVLIGAAVIGLVEMRKIAQALARIEDTASRNERLTIAVLDRLTPQQGPHA